MASAVALLSASNAYYMLLQKTYTHESAGSRSARRAWPVFNHTGGSS